MTRRQHTTYPFSNDTYPDGISLEVEFNYYPGCRGHCDKFGQKETPDDEPEIEVTLIEYQGTEFELSDSELESLEEFIWDKFRSGDFAD